ncbi:MAG: peptide chain release factor N(5)-glutamine methyltransferase [Desulfuromonas sp.]|nr:peptide chain release factor N(5)-glutamine methyltransferase [Desulfuromonas sp.]
MTECWTVLKVVRWTTDYLTSKGVSSPRLDAELLVGQVLAKDRVGLYLCYDQPLQADELAQIRQLVGRRANREPVQYIIGHNEFWSLPFKVTPSVLIPRADTEILVEEALRLLQETPAPQGPVLDVGTGSGAVAIAVAHDRVYARTTGTKPSAAVPERNSETERLQVDAIDISAAALEIAQHNAAANKVTQQVHFYLQDMAELKNFVANRCTDGYQLILSNPPYISSAQMLELMPEVGQHEPSLALEAGSDGLDYYRLLCNQALACLQPMGWLVVEVGANQAAAVTNLMEQAGLNNSFTRADYAGITRVVGAQAPAGCLPKPDNEA